MLHICEAISHALSHFIHKAATHQGEIIIRNYKPRLMFPLKKSLRGVPNLCPLLGLQSPHPHPGLAQAVTSCLLPPCLCGEGDKGKHRGKEHRAVHKTGAEELAIGEAVDGGAPHREHRAPAQPMMQKDRLHVSEHRQIPGPA